MTQSQFRFVIKRCQLSLALKKNPVNSPRTKSAWDSGGIFFFRENSRDSPCGLSEKCTDPSQCRAGQDKRERSKSDRKNVHKAGIHEKMSSNFLVRLTSNSTRPPNPSRKFPSPSIPQHCHVLSASPRSTASSHSIPQLRLALPLTKNVRPPSARLRYVRFFPSHRANARQAPHLCRFHARTT